MMRHKFSGLIIILCVAMAGIAATATVQGAPAKVNWLASVVKTAKGSHVVGNPAAATKLVEYMSYTCPHCAHFETADAPAFKKQYVASGKASYEVRNYILNGYDLTAAMLARCGGKAKFFGNHAALLNNQKSWVETLDAVSEATKAKIKANDVVGFMTGVYSETALASVMAKRGVTAAQARTCLADKAGLQQILDMTEEARKLGLDGTPSFLVNGNVAKDVYSYQALQPLLAAQ